MSQMMTRQKLQNYYAQNRVLKQNVHRRLAHDHWGTEYFLEEAKGLYGAFMQLLDTGEE
jgi:hypothetical protein